MRLFFATGNSYKMALMRRRMEVFSDLEIVGPKDLGIKIDVVEDGKTAGENAIKKAVAYFKATGLPTIAEDSGLYIDKFSEDKQPGLFVRRVNGRDDLSDEEVFKYYYEEISKLGGESKAHYYSGVALVDASGEVHSTIFNENDFLLTTKLYNGESVTGGTLGPMSYDLRANKYFAERTPIEEENHYKELNEGYRELVKEFVLTNSVKKR